MLDIRKMKPPKGRILVKLLGAFKEEMVDGIIVPAKGKMQAKDALIVKLPDDLTFKDQTFEDTPERRITLREGDVVLLNFIQSYAMFEAIESDEPDAQPQTFVSITPEIIISVYKNGQYMKLDNNINSNAKSGKKASN